MIWICKTYHIVSHEEITPWSIGENSTTQHSLKVLIDRLFSISACRFACERSSRRLCGNRSGSIVGSGVEVACDSERLRTRFLSLLEKLKHHIMICTLLSQLTYSVQNPQNTKTMVAVTQTATKISAVESGCLLSAVVWSLAMSKSEKLLELEKLLCLRLSNAVIGDIVMLLTQNLHPCDDLKI